MTRAITISEAAQQLGIKHALLFKELRRREILGSNNMARTQFVERGFFRIDQRSYCPRGTTIQRWYPITLVTGKGMALLQDVIDDLRRGESATRASQ